jgi:hypothetical protein
MVIGNSLCFHSPLSWHERNVTVHRLSVKQAATTCKRMYLSLPEPSGLPQSVFQGLEELSEH